jgi:hypothetical protein
MYVAKRAGAGFAVYSLEQDPYNPDRLVLLGELRPAIEQDELTLYYQPQVSFRTGRVVQVEALVRPGDVVWALSTSGNSPNVIEAVLVAQGLGASIVGFTGRSGGKLKPLCDLCLCVDHTSSDRIQEIHQLAYHIICDYVEQRFTRPQA